MKVTINGGLLHGKIGSVPSKSNAHRAIICASLSDKPTEIYLPFSNADIDTTIDCLKAMGAEIRRDGERLLVTPISALPASAKLNCNESGSTLRFLLPVAAAILKQADFSGTGRLPERPISDLQRAMTKNGAVFTGDHLPLSVSGGLNAGIYEVSGDVSSQYVSGLLMALPRRSRDSKISLTSPLNAWSYIDMTIDTLSKFGIKIDAIENGFMVCGEQVYHSPTTFTVEGDWSGAAFFLTGGAIGGEVTVNGLCMDSKQGDKTIVEILRKFGAKISVSDNFITVKAAPLSACEVDVSATPDLFPILAVLASGAQGKTVLYNAASLRLKESDRIKSTAAMINSLGGMATEYSDRLEIKGTKLKGGTVDSFGDHRIAMSAAIAASICEEKTSIITAEAVSKSYPGFFNDYEALGGKIMN